MFLTKESLVSKISMLGTYFSAISPVNSGTAAATTTRTKMEVGTCMTLNVEGLLSKYEITFVFQLEWGNENKVQSTEPFSANTGSSRGKLISLLTSHTLNLCRSLWTDWEIIYIHGDCWHVSGSIAIILPHRNEFPLLKLEPYWYL